MGLAFYNVLGAIGGFVSPYIVGCLSNGGSYNSSMYLQGALNLAAALMVLGEGVACSMYESVLQGFLFAWTRSIPASFTDPCACPHAQIRFDRH